MEELRNSGLSSASEKSTSIESRSPDTQTPSRRRLLDRLGTVTLEAIGGCVQDGQLEGQTKPASTPGATVSASGKFTKPENEGPLREGVRIRVNQDPLSSAVGAIRRHRYRPRAGKRSQ